MDPETAEITRLLGEAREGDRSALDGLLPIVYDELKRIARIQFSRERSDHTLQPTGLVNEAYLRLIRQSGVDWKDRSHFFGIAARLMRQILVDHARRQNSSKRGGDWSQTTLSDASGGFSIAAEELVDLDRALDELSEIDARLTRVVECRFFVGMSEEETAEALGLTTRTVRRDWVKARTWLFQRMRSAPRPGNDAG